MLDLEPLRPHLHACYRSLAAQKRAPRQPFEPLALLRACVLAAHLRITSFHKLAALLQQHPLLACAAGFEPQRTPATTTFYDFKNRILHPQTNPNPLRDLAHERQQRKLDAHAPNAPHVRAEVLRVLQRQASDLPPLQTFSQRLSHLLHHAAVLPSAQRGLLADKLHLALSLDSTSIESAASSRGHRTCACDAPRCACPRRYADPDAQIGLHLKF